MTIILNLAAIVYHSIIYAFYGILQDDIRSINFPKLNNSKSFLAIVVNQTLNKLGRLPNYSHNLPFAMTLFLFFLFC